MVDIVANEPNNVPYFLQTNGGQQITVEHNTVQQAGNIISAYGSPTRNFVFRDNIVQFNRYGIVCSIEGFECTRDNLFCRCFPGGVFKGNIFADNLGVAASDNAEERYPAGNYFVSSYQRVGFADFAHGDWRLSANNGTRRRASDGKDPGVDVDTLFAAGAFSAREGRRFEGR
jgi:hypothetical protein